MDNKVAIKLSSRFTQFTFPLLSGVVFTILFWVVTSFIYRDITKLCYWSAGGFLLGTTQGLALQFFLKHFKQFSKPLLLTSILFIEFILGLLLIGPFIWLQLRFVPTSNLHSICCETPIDYGATHYENIHLATADNAVIAGWYVAPTTQMGRVIILIHGYGYDRRGTDFQTRTLIAAGYGVLLYDLRNHGESTGSLNSFNRMQVYPADLLEVVKYLKQKPDIKQIGVVGISLGAFATLNSSADVLNSFSALWMDGLRFENFGALPPAKDPIDYLETIFEQQTRWLAAWYFDTPIPQPSPLFTQIIPTIYKPKLMLVASGLDESERSTNEKLIPLLGNNKNMWIIETAWHIGGRFEVPDEYRKKMLDFFADAFSQ